MTVKTKQNKNQMILDRELTWPTKPKISTTVQKRFANLWVRVFHLYKMDDSMNDSYPIGMLMSVVIQ